jgi:hypothetical protein
LLGESQPLAWKRYGVESEAAKRNVQPVVPVMGKTNMSGAALARWSDLELAATTNPDAPSAPFLLH